jgi:predicted nucleic acid-binding Zn ribbon protein
VLALSTRPKPTALRDAGARAATVAGDRGKCKLSPPAVPRRCEECGKPLTGRIGQLFCSQRCRARFRKRRSRARLPADLAVVQPPSQQLEDAESRARFHRERDLRDRRIRDEEAAIEREVRRIEASGEFVGFLFGVPVPGSIAAVFND